MPGFKRVSFSAGVLAVLFLCALCGVLAVWNSAKAATSTSIHTLPGADSLSAHRSVPGRDVKVRPAWALYKGG